MNLESLRAVEPPKASRVFASLAIALYLAGAAVLVFTPWQQVASGKGRVIAYAPLDRQQDIEAPIEGRLVRWFVKEGAPVQEGTPLAEIADNDPALVSRMQDERKAVVSRLEALERRAESLANRALLLKGSQRGAVDAASARIRMASDRIRAAEESLLAADAGFRTATLNLDRQVALAEKGLAATRALELAELDHARARTDRERAVATLTAARSEQVAHGAERAKAETDARAAVEDVEASRAAVMAEAASVRAELTRIDVRLSRQEAQLVRAPRDGVILQLSAYQGGEMVKPGDPIAVLVPIQGERAVELWANGNDVPLISDGRAVRLQFEGWPALQFAGWPSVAVGTFGGKVAFVDATDDGQGRFRVVVVHDGREPWPEERYLRQGVRANGWILLNQVPLGYELWRQFNGFPPAIDSSEKGAAPPAKRVKS